MISFILDKSSYNLPYFDELLGKCIDRRLAYIKTVYNPSDLTKGYKHYKKEWSEGIQQGKKLLLYYCEGYKFRAFCVMDLPDEWTLKTANKIYVRDLVYSSCSYTEARDALYKQFLEYERDTYGTKNTMFKNAIFGVYDDIELETDLFSVDWSKCSSSLYLAQPHIKALVDKYNREHK